MTPSGCDQIPAELVRTLLQSIERCGYDAAPLLKGLQPEPRALLSRRATVPWAGLCGLVNRFTAQQGQAELERVLRDFTVCAPGLRLLGSLLLPPRTFYRALVECWTRACFWTLRYEEERSTVTICVDLKRTMEGCAPLLGALGALLSASPRLLNLPDVLVDSRVLSGHAARYVFELPRGRGLTVRLNEAQLAALVAQFADTHRHGRTNALPSIATLEARHGLTRAEGRVVRRLGAGSSITEIARELGVGTETVRTHTKRAMHKTDTHRQAELVALVLRAGSGARFSVDEP